MNYLGYRSKVKLADVGEEFANLCHADGFGCVQFLDSKKVEITYQPGCNMPDAFSYLERHRGMLNEFIEHFLQG